MNSLDKELIYLVKKLDEITDKATDYSKELSTIMRDTPHVLTLLRYNKLTGETYELSCAEENIRYYTNRLYRLTNCFKRGDA